MPVRKVVSFLERAILGAAMAAVLFVVEMELRRMQSRGADEMTEESKPSGT